MQDGPLKRYRQMVLARELAPDTAQELAAEKLQLLANRLAQYSEPKLGDLLPFARRRRTAPLGLYLYGGVGRGKTMLLDLFFGVGLIASAAAEPHALYVDGVGAESFARTASRLMEMRSEAYLAERHKGGGRASGSF